jgi:hypothetical protein
VLWSLLSKLACTIMLRLSTHALWHNYARLYDTVLQCPRLCGALLLSE